VLEKLRAALADKVAREERIVSRDKQASEGVMSKRHQPYSKPAWAMPSL
jgi:hypothetical protein